MRVCCEEGWGAQVLRASEPGNKALLQEPAAEAEEVKKRAK